MRICALCGNRNNYSNMVPKTQIITNNKGQTFFKFNLQKLWNLRSTMQNLQRTIGWSNNKFVFNKMEWTQVILEQI